MGLCYITCAKLTEGKYPIRSTAFSCCKEQPCEVFNTVYSNPLSYCSGYDVAGNFASVGRSKVCPHKPGDCLLNEEFYMGVCYKRCSLLTEKKFNYRSSASSCCLYDSQWACMTATNTMTSADYNIGG